jgi:hypothetical protein
MPRNHERFIDYASGKRMRLKTLGEMARASAKAWATFTDEDRAEYMRLAGLWETEASWAAWQAYKAKRGTGGGMSEILSPAHY